jgi:hypothetical protein
MAKPIVKKVVYNGVLSSPIDDLGLGTRAHNGVMNAGMRFVGDLVQKTEAELLFIKNFASKSLEEVKAALAELDLSLDMRIDEQGKAVSKYRNVLVRTPAGSVILEESDTDPDKLERQVNEVLGSLSSEYIYVDA